MNASSTITSRRKPHRVRHSHTQQINATPGEVFPLLCPVRELDWVHDWRPDWVISDSGFAEPGCVFQTPGDGQTPAATWVVADYDPAACRLSMIRVIPEHTVTRLDASLQADGQGHTRATIAYEFTALGQAGGRFVAECTTDWYRRFMERWETAMNHYLATGEKLSV